MKIACVRICSLLQMVLVVACGGSGGGGGGVLDAPMANVEGVWSASYTNTGQAVFTGCNGDLAGLNGLTAQFVFGLSSCSGGYPVVGQNANAFTVYSQGYSCSDGSTGVTGGGGTVTGNSVQGQLDSISSSGTIGVDHISGTVNGDALNLTESRMELRGSYTGSCQFSPPLRMSGSIIRDKASHAGGSSLAATALAYVRKAN